MKRVHLRKAAMIVGLLLMMLIMVTCAPAYRGEPIVGPLDTTDPQLSLGERAFARNCHECHPGGAAGLGPGINDKPLPASLIRFQVRNGLGVMPAFAEERLSNAELDAIVAYLLTLRQHGMALGK